MRIYEKSMVQGFLGLGGCFVFCSCFVLFFPLLVWHLQDLVFFFFKIEAFSKPSFQVTLKETKAGNATFSSWRPFIKLCPGCEESPSAAGTQSGKLVVSPLLITLLLS